MVQRDKLREEFSKRLAQASRRAKLDEHGRGIAIARALGVTSKAVSKWFNAEAMPRQDKMNELANYLDVSPFWLQHGAVGLHADSLKNKYEGENFKDDSKGIDSNITNPIPYSRGVRYPVLSRVQAGAWSEACEPYTLKDIDLWLESDAHTQGDAFWLEVEGDSMTAPMGLSIPEGTFVLFDTGREAVNGNLVIAKLVDDNEATFKKLVIDGSQKFLKGLNPQWPMTPINGNCRIIGVAIETKLRLI